jgi:DNA repair protein RadC
MEATLNSESKQVEAITINNQSIQVSSEVRAQISAKISELKAQSGVKHVFVVIVEGDVEAGEKPLYIAYFRRPNMMQFSQYMSFVQKDVVQASKMLAQNTFLDGDRALIDDEDMFLYGTMQQLNHIIDSRNSDIVKR